MRVKHISSGFLLLHARSNLIFALNERNPPPPRSKKKEEEEETRPFRSRELLKFPTRNLTQHAMDKAYNYRDEHPYHFSSMTWSTLSA